MDIYKYAESINYAADYLDPHTGYIYLIQEYGESLKMGSPAPGIRVKDETGRIVGIAKAVRKEK